MGFYVESPEVRHAISLRVLLNGSLMDSNNQGSIGDTVRVETKLLNGYTDDGVTITAMNLTTFNYDTLSFTITDSGVVQDSETHNDTYWLEFVIPTTWADYINPNDNICLLGITNNVVTTGLKTLSFSATQGANSLTVQIIELYADEYGSYNELFNPVTVNSYREGAKLCLQVFSRNVTQSQYLALDNIVSVSGASASDFTFIDFTSNMLSNDTMRTPKQQWEEEGNIFTMGSSDVSLVIDCIAKDKPILLRSEANYTSNANILNYDGQSNMAEVNLYDGLILTIKASFASNYTPIKYKFVYESGNNIVDISNDFIVTSSGMDSQTGEYYEVYTIDQTLLNILKGLGILELYVIPQVRTDVANLYSVGFEDYNSPQDISNYNNLSVCIAENRTLFRFSRFESVYKVFASSTLQFETTYQAYSQYPIIFDEFGSTPSGVTQVPLAFDFESYFNFNASNNKCLMQMPKQDYTMQAKFKFETEKTPYGVYYYVDTFGSQPYKVGGAFDGDTIPVSEIPVVKEWYVPSGKEFDYWADNNVEFDFSTPITSNKNLEAIWKQEGPTMTHDIVFKANGETISTIAVNDGEKIPAADIPTAPLVEGKEFDYWACNGVQFDFDTLIIEDIELDAVYKDLEYTVTYVEGNTTTATVKVKYNGYAPNLEPKSAEDGNGNEFVYWKDANNVEFDFKTPITEDITLTAYYVKGGNDKWVMSLDNCFVGLKSDVADLPIARVANGTKALALSETEGEETAYIFYRKTLTWIELQKYTVNL